MSSWNGLDMNQLTQAVKDKAHRLGFPLAGVTVPDPPPHLAVFERWLAAGRHGEMAYLADERSRMRRADPLQILPGCQSILVLGARYPDPGPVSENPNQTGLVAAYAWGQDYHDVFPDRLRDLVAFIEEQVGQPVPNRWYTDTGPLLERDLAQRAGLGWIGKNTCLIHPRFGSYFLLAEILLGLPLAPDPPFVADRCGTCTRCLEACPTDCILPDRTIDASRCISYLTIELKGTIPLELRTQVGEWVFGCDICQQVCPWNQHASPLEVDPAFLPPAGRSQLDLANELALAPAAFNRKFKGTPVRRARRRGYLRSAAVALGNRSRGQPEAKAISALGEALRDPEPLVRGHAAWALGQLHGEAACQLLRQAQETESDPAVLDEIRQALRGGCV